MKPSRIIVILASLTLLISLTACTTDGGAPSDGPKGQGNQSTGGNLSNKYVEVSAEAGVAPTISSPSGTPPTTLVTEGTNFYFTNCRNDINDSSKLCY